MLLKILRLLPALVFYNATTVFSQEAFIVGETSFCLGDSCKTYSVILSNGTMPTNVTWQVAYPNGLQTIMTINNFLLCADLPGIYSLNAFGQTPNQTFQAELEVNVLTGTNPIIIATSAACPDSASNCEKVCEFTTATYEALLSGGASTPVSWQVQGAENFTADGNQVTVEWGAAGQGQVTASVGSSGGGGAPLQLFCGQSGLGPSPTPGTLMGVVNVTTHDAVLPFNYSIFDSNTNLEVFVGISNDPNFNVAQFPPGNYIIKVGDAAGQVAQCPFTIVVNDSDCWLTAIPVELAHASDCNACDGFIGLNVVSGGVTTQYTYLWSNGSTTSSLSNLCPGTYYVTVTDALGCTDVEAITIHCPTGSCSGESTLCVDILKKPEAVIVSTPAANANDIIVVCQGQTVYFENQSTDASSYVWDFGDFTTSAQFEPSHVYPTPGVYNVLLIARNECFCSDTSFVEVYVLPANVPDIQCLGTVCEGESVTYTTSASCGSHTWIVSPNGFILDGGGAADNFVTVQWNTGAEGTISLEVSGCAGVVCNEPNVVPIAILSDNVQIQGRDKVCQDATEEYFIPDFDGTDITWTVLGSGTIKEGQGSNRITVHWYGDANVGNPQRVIVEFNNCYLECSGRDTLPVLIVPQFYATGPIEICQNATGTFQSRNAITDNLMPSNWQVFNQLGNLVWSSPGATNTVNIPFSFLPGSYTVRAMPASASSFCNDEYDVFVKITALPPQPTSILGEDEICPGIPYSYEATGQAGNDFTWTIRNGAITTAMNGNPINVTWGNAPPYSVSVAQIATTGLGCTGDTTSLVVQPIPDFSIVGSSSVCKETTETYSVPAFQNVDFQWTISPADAGTVLSPSGGGGGAETVDVLWHRPGAAVLSVKVCGTTKTFNVTVNDLPEPFVDDQEVCFGSTGSVTATPAFASYAWRNEGGTTVSAAANPSLGAGFYELEVTDANGCVGDTTFEIFELPEPNISISTPSYSALCAGGPPAILHAVVSGEGYDYAWTRNGVPVGTNSSTHSTTQPGDYVVVITDVDGCTATSNLLTLFDCSAVGGTCVGGLCLGGGGGPPLPGSGCVAAGNVDFSPMPSFTDCAKFNFTNTTINGVSGSFYWTFGNGNISPWDNPPTQTYPGAGYYSVLLTGSLQATSPPGGACPDGVLHDILVPVEAGFQHSTACPGAPVNFEDKSVFIPPASITAWSWDFGDPASGAANTSTLTNPSHTFATPGDYVVKLTITSTGGCKTSFTDTIIVHQPPSIQFLPPNLTCENAPLPFSAQLFSDVTSVSWNFGEPASGAANTSELFDLWHEFENPGSYLVTLTAANVFGCTSGYSTNVSVTPNTMSGNISMSPGSPICEGASSTLTAPVGGVSWEWSSGEATASITASVSNAYSVTVINAQGCIYSPPPAVLEVVAEPNGIIKAVEYNEFGQPVAFFENTYSVCEGDEVFLVIQGSLSNSYTWSNGETGDEVSFEEIKNNLLATGTHTFNVVVTDGGTGCTSFEGPFTVTVNPVPTVQIASAPSGFLCENNPATLNVVSPQPGLTYSWNTGELGTSISVVAGGTYFARAVNNFGCKGNSNEIELHNAPDIGKIPTGCHTRCQPDTMCLPYIQDVASYQWFFNGSPMAAPNGTQANPIFAQSGDYFVEMTDVFGCASTSEVLSLDLQPGVGDIGGEVWFDVNKNGVIDAGDTLVSNVNIFIGNGSGNLDTVSSDQLGNYLFDSILAQNYTLQVDTLNLPPNWSAVLASTTVQLTGCGDTEQFDWLLQINCPTQTMMIDMSACPGDGVTYDGIFIPAGDTHIFNYTDQIGCDSTIIVTVLELPSQTMQVDLTACPGGSATYNGTPIATGETETFTFTNQFGCDSNVVVTVLALPEDTTQVELGACAGATVDFNGQQLSIGEQGNWLGVNQFGCDSLVQATVVELPHGVLYLDPAVCENSFYTYQGQQIMPGYQEIFTQINPFGCIDTIIVTVLGFPVDSTSEALFACAGSPVTYGGQQLLPGFEGYFTFQNIYGCDSVVQVSVATSPPVDFLLDAPQICPDSTNGRITVGNISGSTAPYSFSMDGQNFQPEPVFENLPPGTYEVLLQDANGCLFEQNAVLPTYAPLFVTVPEQVLFCGDSVQLSPVVVSSQLPATLTWQDGSTQSSFWATQPGEYIFTASNSCQEIEGSILVDYDLSVPPPQIFVPNAFSPNGDGFNDCFRAYAATDVQLIGYQLKIFDRWGNFLFETNELEGCWDGRRQGKLLDPAVVVWFLTYQYENCAGEAVEVFREGGVTLLR